MRSFPNARRCLSWALACQVATLPALADPATCSTLAVQLERDARSRHPELTERIRNAFAARDDIDTCAHVELDMAEDDILVGVTLADGRKAERRVQRADDVVPTLEALLVVPGASAVSDSPEPFQKEEPVVKVPEASRARPRFRPPARPRLTTRERGTPERTNPMLLDRPGVEVALVAGASVGDDQQGMSLGVLGLLDLSSWLVGIQARAREYRAQASTRPANAWATFELAALGGHRLRFPTFELDFVAGPAAAIDGGSVSETRPSPPEQHPESQPGIVPRFVGATHFVFAPRSLFHGFVGFEGEVGARGSDATHGAYALPVWMVGLAVGAAVGSR